MRYYKWKFYINEDTSKTYECIVPVLEDVESDDQNQYANKDGVPYYATTDDNDLSIPHKTGLVGLYDFNYITLSKKVTNLFDIISQIYGSNIFLSSNYFNIALRTVGGNINNAVVVELQKSNTTVFNKIKLVTNYTSHSSSTPYTTYGVFNDRIRLAYYSDFLNRFIFSLAIDKVGKVYPIIKGRFSVYTKFGYRNWGFSYMDCIQGGIAYTGQFTNFFGTIEEVKRYETSGDDEWGYGVIDNSSDEINFPTLPQVTLNKFTHTYKLSEEQLQSLKNELFSDDILSILKKWWDKPLDCIVSLSVLPLALSEYTQSNNIIVGTHSMNSTGSEIANPLAVINCGYVDLNEYYGNFIDYENTIVQAYLPFVGFIPIKTVDAMGGTLYLKYIVNLITGAFNCFIMIERNRYNVELKSVLYETTGNMATQLPVTSSDFSNIVKSVTNTIVSTATTVASGGFGISNAIESVSSLLTTSPAIQRSGNFDKNSSLCSLRQPFILIERPRIAIPNNFESRKGFLSNTEKKLSDIKGYTEVAYINMDNIDIPKNCIDELKTILTSGVIL